MKLTSTQVKQTLKQFDAEAIPENHPAAGQLNQVFGDHTFFLDLEGLHIVAPVELPSGNSQTGTCACQIVKLASWKDSSRDSLTPHEPEPADFYIIMAA